MDIGFANTGTSDEEAILTITNKELSINLQENVKLNDDPFDSGSTFTKKYRISSQQNGQFPIIAKLSYDGQIEEKSALLSVEGCKNTTQNVKKVETKLTGAAIQITPQKTANAFPTTILLAAIVFIIAIALFIAVLITIKR